MDKLRMELRKTIDRGGWLCMPLVKNVPEGKEGWEKVHYPYLEGNTLHHIKAGEIKQIVFARREDAEERLEEMKDI